MKKSCPENRKPGKLCEFSGLIGKFYRGPGRFLFIPLRPPPHNQHTLPSLC